MDDFSLYTSTEAAYDAYGHVVCGDLWGSHPFAGGCFDSVERLAFRDLPNRLWKPLKKWLYQRGVPFRQRVVVLPVFTTASTPALLTTWKMIVAHAEAFFAEDNTALANAAAHWCLYYHHDGIFSFGHHGPPRDATLPTAYGNET